MPKGFTRAEASRIKDASKRRKIIRSTGATAVSGGGQLGKYAFNNPSFHVVKK